MSYKQFPFRGKNQWNKLDSPEKRVYDKFLTEISGLIVDGYDWALLRVWRDGADILQVDVYFEWSWYPYTYECTSELYKDIKEVEYEEFAEIGVGYYLVTINTEYELEPVEHSDRYIQVYFKTIGEFVKFISIDEVEGLEDVL